MLRAELILFGISLIAVGAHAEAPKTLAWKFKPGQKFRVATRSEMTRSTKIKANIDESKINTIIDVLWEVKDVSADGIATIEQRPERLAITFDHRNGANIDPVYTLDSDILKKSPNLKGPDRDALRLLMEGSATIKLDARGVVRESSVPPDWSEKLKASSLAEMHDQLVLAATPQLFPGVQLSLPADSIEPGHEWLVEAEKIDAKPASPRGSAKFVYQGAKPLEGIDREQIEIALTIEDLDKEIAITSQSNQGQFWFDNAEGHPVMLQVNQDWKAEKTYRDTLILLTTRGVSKTTWTPIPLTSKED